MQQMHAIILQCARSCMEKSGVSHPISLGIPGTKFGQLMRVSCDGIKI